MSITVYLLLLLLLFSLVLCINLRMHFLFSLLFLEFGFVFFGDKKRFALVYAEKKREAEEENANKAFFVYLSFSLSWQHVVVALVLLAVVVAALVAKQCKKCLDKLKIKSNCKINEDSVCSCVCVCEEELQGAWVLEKGGVEGKRVSVCGANFCSFAVANAHLGQGVCCCYCCRRQLLVYYENCSNNKREQQQQQ